MKHFDYDYDYLHECFEYRNGELFWKHRPLHHFKNERGMNVFNSQFSGTKSGSIKFDGYVKVHIRNKIITAHSIVYAMHNKTKPHGLQIDHINGNPSDNRIENLRLATQSQQCQNRKMFKNNSSGVKGVHLHKRDNKWYAQIGIDKVLKHLGSFDTKEEAIAARRAAEQKYFGEFARAKSD